MSNYFSHKHDAVPNITTAASAHSAEMHSRMVRYSVAMAIRIVCLIFVFIVPGWWKLVPVVGAVAIPWFAVVIANAGGDTEHPDQSALLQEHPHEEIAAGHDAPADDRSGPEAEGQSGDERARDSSAEDDYSHAGGEDTSTIIRGETVPDVDPTPRPRPDTDEEKHGDQQ